MNKLLKIYFSIILYSLLCTPANAVDMLCEFEEYNVKIPDVKAHDIHIHIKFNDNKNTISYVHFGKIKKVDSIVDYNYEYLLFKIKYKYSFGNTDVLYKIDRVTNQITVDRSEVLNANRSYTAKYKGYGKCEIIPRKNIPKL